jgi:hypothetical protein
MEDNKWKMDRSIRYGPRVCQVTIFGVWPLSSRHMLFFDPWATLKYTKVAIALLHSLQGHQIYFNSTALFAESE